MRNTDIKSQVEAFVFRLLIENPNHTAAEVLAAVRSAIGDTQKQAKSAPKAAKAAPAAAPDKAPTKAKKNGFSPRTLEGRTALDQSVRDALTKLGPEGVPAEHIRKAIGGTPHQIRTSLNRQIESGAITYTGQKRGTRYALK